MNQKPTVPGREWLLSWSNVEQLMAQGNFRHAFHVGRHAVLTHRSGHLGVEVQLEDGEDCTKLPVLPQALEFRADSQTRILTVTCVAANLQRTFYSYVCEALELIKGHGLRSSSAFQEAWVHLGELLEQEAVLTREKQLGLIGELTFLKLLASQPKFGWSGALAAWHQSANAEHDFALETCDVEVKSTSKEVRSHVIGSLNQLTESPNRDLFMLSFQFSPSPAHAKGSTTLEYQVKAITSEIGHDNDLLSRFTGRLERAGWCSEHGPNYTACFVQRSSPRLIKVDDSFPRITPATLGLIPPDQLARINSVIYSVDVSGMGSELNAETLNQLLL
jgi:hypothetical protein